MNCQELQEEELEVLRSIYDGDEAFKEITSTVFQYMIGDKSDPKCFLLEIAWEDRYPEVQPTINMDTFFNKHIIQEVKENIVSELIKEATQLVGTPMTYNLIEWAKENFTELTKEQPDKPALVGDNNSEALVAENPTTPVPSVKPKRPQLTKQQKRKLANRVDAKGEMPRGWNWVDIIKHLNQGGGKSSTSSAASAAAATTS